VEATAGRGWLRLRWLDGAGNVIPSAAGEEVVTARPIKIMAPGRPPRPENELLARFGDELALVGYSVEQSGRQVRLKLLWRGVSGTAGDYTRFVHLIDAAGQLVAQVDGTPQNDYYPTSIWDAGEQVADEVNLAIPAGTAGSFRLALGFYRPESLERLAVVVDGQELPDGLLLLPERLEEGAE
jgi:hypothetical protein